MLDKQFGLPLLPDHYPNNNFAWGYYPPAKHYYMYMGGTSMATPLVAGCAALVRQYLREKRGISNPSAALVKAALIHSAEYINYRFAHPSSSPGADDEQGWGRINLKRVLNPGSSIQVHFVDESQGLMTGDKREYEVEIVDNSVPLRATLVYTDYPGEKLVNNLNLILYSPSGKYYLGNDFKQTGSSDSINNVEGVIVESPEIGIWKLGIIGSNVLQESQDYALIVSGAIALKHCQLFGS
jgi:hypothetical protein